MTFPFVTTITTGILLILQIALAFTVSGNRGKNDTWVGDGGNDGLLRAMRRHGNFAENAAIFLVGFMLLEFSKFSTWLLVALCVIFVAARLLHAIGLSQQNTNNAFRFAGGIGTYVLGFILGGTLIWIGASIAMHGGMQ